MGLLDTLKVAAVSALGFKTLPQLSNTGSRQIAPDRRAFEQQAKAYLNQIVLACIATRAQTLNEAPVTAVDVSSGAMIPTHPLTRLFRRPNPYMSQAMFWQYVSTYTDIGGNAYIHKVRNVYGQVIELWPFHDGHIKPVSDSGNWVDYYRYSFDGVTVDIDPRDIIHIRSYYIDPLNPIVGISPIRAAGLNIDTYNELMQTLYSYLKNNGVPSGVLSVQQSISQLQSEALKEQFQANTTGKNRGKPIVLPSGMTYTQMGLDVSTLEASAQFKQYETAICSIYRVHPSVVMTTAGLDSSTYSNMQTAHQEFTLLTRVPTWNTWGEQIELSFANEYPDVNVEFDKSNVAALKADTDAINSVVGQYQSNLITLNEARTLLGYTEVDNGEVYSYQTSPPAPAFLEAPDTGQKGMYGYEDLPKSGKIDQTLDTKAEAFWRGMDTVIRDAAEDLKPETSKLMADVGKVLTANLASGKSLKASPELDALVAQYMKATGKWREALLNKIVPLAIQEVGADLSAVQGFVDELAAKVAREMNDGIKASVNNVEVEVGDKVSQWATDELPEKTDRATYIQGKLTETFEGLSTGRANAIARTTARALSSTISTDTWDTLNEGNVDTDEEIVKVWTTRRDAVVRESHRKLDGDWVVMKDPFKTGLQAPGVGEVAGETVNCRCVLRPVKRKNLGRQAQRPGGE